MTQVFHPRFGKAFQDGPPVSEWLGVQSYDGKHLVYRLSGGRIAQMLEIEPVWDGTLTLEGRDHVLTRLEQVFRSVQEGFAGQFLMLRQHKVEPDLARYESLVDTSGDPDAHLLHRINSDLYRAALERGFGNLARFRPRRNRLFLTLSREIDARSFAWVRRSNPAAALAAAATGLHEQMDQVAQALEELGTDFRAVGPQEVLQLLRDLMGIRGANDEDLPPWDPACPFGAQLGLSSIEVDPTDVWLDRDRTDRARLIRALSLQERPERTKPGIARDFLRMEGEGAIVLNFRKVSRTEMFGLIGRKEAIADRVMGWGIKNPEADAFTHQARMYRLEGMADEWVKASWHILVWGRTDAEVKRAAQQAESRIGSAGFGMQAEDVVGPEAVRQCLPFGFNPCVVEKFVGRMLSYRVGQVVSLVPISVAPRGTGAHAPECMFLSEDMEVAYLSTYEATAPHMVVMGGTGSGKSLVVLKLLMEFLRLGHPGSGQAKRPYIGIIDIRETYKTLAEYIGGEYLRFSLNCGICLNPFHQSIFDDAGILKREEYAFQASLLISMIAGDEDTVDRVQRGLIKQALLMTQDAFRGAPIRPRLTDVIETLDAHRDKFGDLGENVRAQVYDFTENGQFGALIDGQYNLSTTSDFQVFNLNDLQSVAEAQAAVLRALIYGIRGHVEPTNAADEDTPPAERGAVVCDEVWSLLGKSDVAGEFLDEAARAYRHYGVSLITITQNPDDFSTKAGQTVLANSPTKIFLQMDGQKHGLCEQFLGLDPQRLEILKRVRTKPGLFSEFLLDSQVDGATGLYRFPTSAHTLWLGATSTEDRALKADAMRRFPGDVRGAIDWLAANYPNGAKRGRVAPPAGDVREPGEHGIAELEAA